MAKSLKNIALGLSEDTSPVLDESFVDKTPKSGQVPKKTRDGRIQIPLNFANNKFSLNPLTLLHELATKLATHGLFISDSNLDVLKSMIKLQKSLVSNIAGEKPLKESESIASRIERNKIRNPYTNKPFTIGEIEALRSYPKFIEYALDNKNFQELLKQIKVGDDSNLYNEFVNNIQQVLKISDNDRFITDEAGNNIDVVAEIVDADYRISKFGEKLTKEEEDILREIAVKATTGETETNTFTLEEKEEARESRRRNLEVEEAPTRRAVAPAVAETRVEEEPTTVTEEEVITEEEPISTKRLPIDVNEIQRKYNEYLLEYRNELAEQGNRGSDLEAPIVFLRQKFISFLETLESNIRKAQQADERFNLDDLNFNPDIFRVILAIGAKPEGFVNAFPFSQEVKDNIINSLQGDGIENRARNGMNEFNNAMRNLFLDQIPRLRRLAETPITGPRKRTMDLYLRRLQQGRVGMTPEMVEARLRELGYKTDGIIKVINDPNAEFEGRIIIRNGKVIRIELNAAALYSNADIDRVLNHEFAEAANADGALNYIIKNLTKSERKQINDAITELGYDENVRTSEEAARAIERLAEAWKGRGFFARAVGRILAWANKLGLKMTRLAAEYIAAKNLAEINKKVRDINTGITETEAANRADDIRESRRGETEQTTEGKPEQENATTGSSIRENVASFFNLKSLKRVGAYAKRMQPPILRLFGLGNRIEELQKIIEGIDGFEKKLSNQAKTIGNRLRRAAKLDKVIYEDIKAQINDALATRADGPNELQYEQIFELARSAGQKASYNWLRKNLTEKDFENYQTSGLRGDDWLKQYKPAKDIRRYMFAVKRAENRQRKLATNAVIRQNLEASYKKASDALNSLTPNVREEVLRARQEIEEVYGTAISNGVIPYNAKLMIGDRETDIKIREITWIKDNIAFARKLKQDPNQMQALTRSLQSMYINNRIREIKSENRKEGDILTDDEARRIAESEMTLEKAEEVAKSYINAAVSNPDKAFMDIIVPQLKLTQAQKLLGPAKILKDVVTTLSDPEINYAQLLLNLSEEVAYSNGFEKMKELGLTQGWILDPTKDPIPEGYLQIEKSNIPGFSRTFKGLYADPIFVKEINDTYNKPGALGGPLRVLIGMNSMSMASQTVLALPRGQIRNFVGNIFLFIATGNWDITQLVKEGETAWAVFKEKGNPEVLAAINRLQELGILDSNVDANMIQDQIKMAKADDFGMIAKIFNQTQFKRGMDAMTRLYNMFDNIWKLAVFSLEKKTLLKAYANGIPANIAGTKSELMPNTPEYNAKIEELAADRTKSSMVSYNRMNQIGRWAKKPGYQAMLASFIGFQSEMIRIGHTNIRTAISDISSGNATLKAAGYRKLIGTIGGSSSVLALGFFMKELFDIGEEEEEAARATLPPWDKDATLIWWRDSNGNLEYFNTSSVNPFSQIGVDPIRAALSSWRDNDDKGALALGQAIGTGLKYALSGYFEPQIFVKAAAEARFNDKGGAQIYNPEAPASDIAWDIGNHFADVLLPSTLRRPLQGFIRAITGEPDRQGEVPALVPAAINFLFARSNSVKPESYFRNKMYEMNKRKRDAARLVTREITTKGNISDEDVRTSYGKANEAIYDLMADAAKVYRRAIILGQDTKNLDTIMKDSIVSKTDQNAIKSGYIKPYRVAKTTLKDIPEERAKIIEEEMRNTKPRDFKPTGALSDPFGMPQQRPSDEEEDFG